MGENLQEQCPDVTWCTETRAHFIHQQTLGTWLGESVNGAPHGVTAQVVVFGKTERMPRLALVLLDSTHLEQIDIELSWHQAVEMAVKLEEAAGRFRPLMGG